MQHGTRISPPWVPPGKWQALGWFWGHRLFIQLLEYYFSTLQFCHLYFYSFKNLWVLLVTPDCTVQSACFPLPLRGMLLSEICWGPSLEQHPFLGHWAGLMARRAAGFKGPNASPQQVRPWKSLWWEQTPEKTQRMQPGSLFQLLISLSRICQDYSSDASCHKGPFVLPSWGKQWVSDKSLLRDSPFIFGFSATTSGPFYV